MTSTSLSVACCMPQWSYIVSITYTVVCTYIASMHVANHRDLSALWEITVTMHLYTEHYIKSIEMKPSEINTQRFDCN